MSKINSRLKLKKIKFGNIYFFKILNYNSSLARWTFLPPAVTVLGEKRETGFTGALKLNRSGARQPGPGLARLARFVASDGKGMGSQFRAWSVGWQAEF